MKLLKYSGYTLLAIVLLLILTVAFGYNREIIAGLLREKYGFKGVDCSDWELVADIGFPGVMLKPASAHGVEQLFETKRVAEILEAGCNMLGGKSNLEWIVELVNSGKIESIRQCEGYLKINSA